MNFFSLFSPRCASIGGKSSAGESRHRSLTGNLKRVWFAPPQESGPVRYWFVPSHDLALRFRMFSSPFTIRSPRLFSHGTHKNHFNARPTSSSSFWVPGLMAPVHLFCRQFAVSFTVGFSFTFDCQILGWCNFSFRMSFTVTVGELVGNVTLYSHPFCQPGSHVTPAMALNQSRSLGLVTEFWINLLCLSLVLVLILRNQSSSLPLTVLTVTCRSLRIPEVFWPWDSRRPERGHQQRGWGLLLSPWWD